MFMLDNKPLALDTPFTHADIQYPANWLRLATPSERAAIGITEADEPAAYDDRFYWSAGNAKQLEDVTETPEGQTEPVTTKGLKSQWLGQVKQTAGSLLAQTDWMVIRKAERDVAIPEDVVLKRARVVAEANRLEEAITASETVEDLIAVVTQQQWPTDKV